LGLLPSVNKAIWVDGGKRDIGRDQFWQDWRKFI